MKSRQFTSLVLAALCGLIFAPTATADIAVGFGSGTNQFNLDFVTIGSPGNAADTTGNPNPAGAVGYTYNIGKYEVSRDMITKANAASGNLGIYMTDMTAFGGNGVNRPATGISWNAAARFVNWLNTSQGFAPAYSFALQPGDVGYSVNANIQLWTTSDPGYNMANPFRNSLANYFLPSVDEWYKAAYYDPSKPNSNGGLGDYWNYPTGSDTAPTAVVSGTTAGTAVYGQSYSTGPADISNAGGLSPFGVMGLGGNVYEFMETETDLGNDNPSSVRVRRGGNWDASSINFKSSNKTEYPPHLPSNVNGFRVASLSVAPVPELGSLAVWSSVAVCGLVWSRRRLKQKTGAEQIA